MISNVHSKKLPNEILIPSSKSYANRHLILAALSPKALWFGPLPSGNDVSDMLHCLQQLGIKFQRDGLRLRRIGPAFSPEKIKTPLTLEVGEGGTTARFLAALVAMIPGVVTLKLAGRLAERPWDELLGFLHQANVQAELMGHELRIRGPAQWDKLPNELPMGRSSQFMTAIQLALSNTDRQLIPSGDVVSEAYWRMTLGCVEEWRREDEIQIPLDWSSASYPMALAAISGQRLLFPHLRPDPLQADYWFGEWLVQRSALGFSPQGALVGNLVDRSPLEVDLLLCPDVGPTLAVMATHLNGTSILKNVSVLRHKESDRLSGMLELLQQFAVPCEYDRGADVLFVDGNSPLKSCSIVEVAPDHRMVMCAAMLSWLSGGGQVGPSQAVAKSFPEFFSALGFD